MTVTHLWADWFGNSVMSQSPNRTSQWKHSKVMTAWMSCLFIYVSVTMTMSCSVVPEHAHLNWVTRIVYIYFFKSDSCGTNQTRAERGSERNRLRDRQTERQMEERMVGTRSFFSRRKILNYWAKYLISRIPAPPALVLIESWRAVVKHPWAPSSWMRRRSRGSRERNSRSSRPQVETLVRRDPSSSSRWRTPSARPA